MTVPTAPASGSPPPAAPWWASGAGPDGERPTSLDRDEDPIERFRAARGAGGPRTDAVQPEVADHLAEAFRHLAAAARLVVDHLAERPDPRAARGTAGTAEPRGEPEPPEPYPDEPADRGLERIELDR